MDRHIYDDVLDDFETYFPQLAKYAVSWYPSGRREITVKLSDGDRIVFDGIAKTFRRLSKPDSEMADEDSWRIGFGRRLTHILNTKGLSQNALSEMSGLSQTMISRYITGNSLPSAYAVARLAHALECSTTELTDFN